jgi:hypothetical protein
MHAYMRAYMHTYMHTHIYTLMYIWPCACMKKCIHAWMHRSCVETNIQLCIFQFPFMCSTRAQQFKSPFKHTHACIHTDIHVSIFMHGIKNTRKPHIWLKYQKGSWVCLFKCTFNTFAAVDISILCWRLNVRDHIHNTSFSSQLTKRPNKNVLLHYAVKACYGQTL